MSQEENHKKNLDMNSYLEDSPKEMKKRNRFQEESPKKSLSLQRLDGSHNAMYFQTNNPEDSPSVTWIKNNAQEGNPNVNMGSNLFREVNRRLGGSLRSIRDLIQDRIWPRNVSHQEENPVPMMYPYLGRSQSVKEVRNPELSQSTRCLLLP